MELKINQEPSMTYFQMNLRIMKNTCVVFHVLYWTQRCLWNFFLLVKSFFPLWNCFSNLIYWWKSLLFIGEVRKLNLEFLRFDYLIQKIWLLNFNNLSRSFNKFANKSILIFNFLLTSIRRFVFYLWNLLIRKYSLSTHIWKESSLAHIEVSIGPSQHDPTL